MAENQNINPVGKIVVLNGSAEAVSSEGTRVLEVGSPVYEDDVVRTEEGSKLQIKFLDNTQVSQGENSTLKIDNFVYNPDPADNSDMLLNMMKGTFRTITGEITKDSPTHFMLKSPQGTIGIRGTIVVSEVTDLYEQHGVEELTPGKILVISDQFGNIRILKVPMQMVEFFSGKPVTEIRDLLLDEINDYREKAPLDLDHGQDDQPLAYTPADLTDPFGPDIDILDANMVPSDFGLGGDQLLLTDGEVPVLLGVFDSLEDIPGYESESGTGDDPDTGTGGGDVYPSGDGGDGGSDAPDVPDLGIQLASLDPSQGFRLEPGEGLVNNGASLSMAGDMNSDGYADVLASAVYQDSYALDESGAVTIFFGATEDETPGSIRIEGFAAETGSEITVSNAGDINGDGYDDIIIGVPGAGTGYGESYVIFGSSTLAEMGTIDVNELGAYGFRIVNEDPYGAPLPADEGPLRASLMAASGLELADDPVTFNSYTVSNAGDIDGDGLDDLIIGSPLANTGYVVYGSQSEEYSDINLAETSGGVEPYGFRIDGSELFGESSFQISGAGDINGDGYDDLIIGADQLSSDENDVAAGQTFVVFGSESRPIGQVDLSTLDGTNGFRLEGGDMFDFSGYAVSNAGDINGDGYDDLLIGAPGADDFTGAGYVVFGGESWDSSLSLDSLDGSNGFAVNGIASGDMTGSAISGLGDINGDGFDDFIIGAPEANGGAGESYVIFGGQDWGESIDLSNLDGLQGFKIEGGEGDLSGYDVSGAGDVNGDGYADILVGGPGEDGSDSGNSYLIYGGDMTGSVTHEGTENGDLIFGTSSADRMVGGQGGDFLYGNGGADVIYGGSGDDTIVASEFFRVDGGSGVDTLNLSMNGGSINLMEIANNKIQGIEKISLGIDYNDTSLTLGLDDVLDISDTTNTLMIDGDAGDTVNLSAGDQWQYSGVDGSETYGVYTSGHATLMVDLDISVVTDPSLGAVV